MQMSLGQQNGGRTVLTVPFDCISNLNFIAFASSNGNERARLSSDVTIDYQLLVSIIAL